jgi:hypothetical protein
MSLLFCEFVVSESMEFFANYASEFVRFLCAGDGGGIGGNIGEFWW